MVHIGNNIYCKRNVIDNTLGVAKNTCHLVRRLINGGFKLEAVIESIFTGQHYRPSLTKNVD